MYFFDTYALIEMMLGNRKYMQYAGFQLTVSPLNIGELYIYMHRTYGKTAANGKLALMFFNTLELTQEIIISAADFKLAHAEKRLSWADCVGYAAAKRRGLKFLTGDLQFRGMPNVEFVK